MKCFFLLLSLFVSTVSFGAANDAGLAHLQELLNLDRFHAYSQAWAHTMMGREQQEAARHILGLTAQELAPLKLDQKKLADAMNYDELIIDILKKQRPELVTDASKLRWEYPFLKRKYNEGYLFGDPSRKFKIEDQKNSIVQGRLDVARQAVTVEGLDPNNVLLNVDGYVADRTTRAVFWEASESQRPIELHVGSAADFARDLETRGGRILGEIKAKANNYNPIYAVQYPGESRFRYAITQISGNDRVQHFAMQTALVRWVDNTGKLVAPAPIATIGSGTAFLAEESRELTDILRTVPKADHVVIGQLGAFERTIGSLNKAQLLLGALKQKPSELAKLVTPAQLRFLEKAATTDDLIRHVLKSPSDWDKVFEAATPLVHQLHPEVAEGMSSKVFSLDRGSYEMSDHILIDADGKPKRWRFFSNSWGDEVIPALNALRATGHKEISYIGTAGGLKGSNLKVGDLAIPRFSHDEGATLRPLEAKFKPQGAITINAVTNVASPFQETPEWLKSRMSLSQAVEVETGHISRIFTAPEYKATTMLLISDMVGVEGETLAEANSSVRRTAQINAIDSTLDHGRVVSVGNGRITSAYFDEMNAQKLKADPAFEVKLVREAQVRGIRPGSANFSTRFKALYDELKNFTTARVEKNLKGVDRIWQSLLTRFDEKSLRPRVSIDRRLNEALWTPDEPVRIHLDVATPEAEAETKKIIAELSGNKANAKLVNITVSREAASTQDFVRLSELPSSPETFLDVYRDGVLSYGGYANVETRSGGLRLVRVSTPSETPRFNNLQYFAPNPQTRELLSAFNSGDLEGELTLLIRQINDARTGNYDGPYQRWNVVMQKVDSLPGGALAEIVPEFVNDTLEVRLVMTAEGLKNPMVAMEEMIHLAQITGWSPNSTVPRVFDHPFIWAETVANAKGGSLAAQEILAALEVEQVMNARHEVEAYGTLFTGQTNDPAKVAAYFEARQAHAESLYKKVGELARVERKANEARWNKQRQAFAGLEAQKDKLNDLVARGDRAGVRKLIDSYMPWDIMEPTEKKAWRTWLDAMEKPEASNRRLIFRGLDGDVILRTPQGKPFLMSTVLTKNQGSYTRRLRSLTTMREKFGRPVINEYNQPDLTRSVKGRRLPPTLSNMMLRHAGDPFGSPFISASNIDTAASFGGQKRAALLIDERRLTPNGLAHGYVSEQERLIPLIVFPDEVVHFEEAPKDSYLTSTKEQFLTEVEAKLGRPLTDAEKTPIGPEYFPNAVENNQKAFLSPDAITAPAPGGKTCLSNTSEGLFSALNELLKN